MKNGLIIYNTDDGKTDIKLYSSDGVIWMNQQQMAKNYNVTYYEFPSKEKYQKSQFFQFG